MRFRSTNLARFVFRSDNHAVRTTASGERVVTHGRGKIECRDSERCSGFDNTTGTVRAAKLIAEFCFLAVKGNKLVAQKGLDLRTSRWRDLLAPFGVVVPYCRFLPIALSVQGN